MLYRIRNKIINILEYLFSKLDEEIIVYDNKIKLNHENQKIKITNNLLFRCLLSNNITQSKVFKLSKNLPILQINHTQTFAAELFKLVNNNNNTANNILILGLGGGDLIRYYSKLFNNLTNITAVELSSDIINIAKNYFYLNNIKNSNQLNLSIINQDAVDFIKETKNSYNLINLDIFTELNSANKLISDTLFLTNLHSKLAPNGIVTFNLIVSNQEILDNIIIKLAELFNNNLIISTNNRYYNIIIFCFNSEQYLNLIDSNKKISYLYNKYFIKAKYSKSINNKLVLSEYILK